MASVFQTNVNKGHTMAAILKDKPNMGYKRTTGTFD